MTLLDWVALGMLPAGVVAVGVIIWRGWLRKGVLAAGPAREVGLHGYDLAVAIGLMFLGMAAYPVAVGQLIDGSQTQELSTTVQVLLVMLGQLMLQGPAAAYFLLRVSFTHHGLAKAGIVTRSPARDLLLGLGALIVSICIVMSVMVIASLIGAMLGYPAPELGHELLQTLRDSDSVQATVLLAVAIVVLAPLFEELIFRGLLQSVLLAMLGKSHRWLVVLIAATLFTLTHIGPATFDASQTGGVSPHALPALCVLGVILGYLYERTGSLWPSIVVHAGFNALNASVVYFAM